MARPTLTKAHRGLLGIVAAGACIISGIGFAGSYNAVRELASEKGFGAFSYAFPIGVDAGIVVLLALDLVLTWLRIPFPLLRQTAWVLTVATIAFNAAASWGDPLGMGMHAVIPVLFVVVVEASRHAVGRIAAITADRHMESVRMMRWLLSPVPTFRLWRRMKLWELRSYDEVVRLEQNRLVYRAQLRFRYGRGWRRSAPIQALLPLKLAKYGVPLDPSLLDRLDEEAREREAREARELQPQEQRAAAAIAPAGPEVSPQPQPQPHQRQAQPLPVQQAPQAQQAQQVQQVQQPGPQTPPQPEPQEAPAAVAPLSAEVAAPMLAKLAAVRLRAAQEPEGTEEEAPQSPREELNVWTTRPVRTTGGHQADASPGGRVPGQASPWFKPPRPLDEEPAPGAAPKPLAQAAPQQQEQDPAPAQEPVQAESAVRADERAPAEAAGPRPAPARLDPELAFEALVSYIDTFEHHPDPQRLAEWLTKEYGLTGNRPDGSVHPKDVAELYPQLRDRYAAAGRD
ncbi:DUF2637 domain-containing protein [Streptomyces sp. SP17BM10]|uniref:DUF2637 domain-containing protein n=1 Tax=Streptomyces sp. SP17BM10 TaxID=3002530 RepID=UPI002E76F5A7|nr:DUF2637 domain-containing protein [Streptomyces sp. SP17BM10]MEE1785581.1 DUF2637 domain-containing protein [Streptomyces sp. SP17BM10]